ncbi:MAG: hypothetical protein WBF55_03640, partial [Syntrophobacteria bacterium]
IQKLLFFVFYNQPTLCQKGAQKAWLSAPGYLLKYDLVQRLSTGWTNHLYGAMLDYCYKYQIRRGYKFEHRINMS